MNGDIDRRNTVALEPAIIKDKRELAEAEARNGLRQYDIGMEAALQGIERGFKLRSSLIQTLNRTALEGLTNYAGLFRPADVAIERSNHVPPKAHLVPELVEHMCDYVNENWHTSTGIHLAAYVMWRINWIHPFPDGNGRTSRMASYVVLTVKSGFVLRGPETIPEQIVANRTPYFDALEAADAAYADGGRIDLSAMEALINGLLARQLISAYKRAGGTTDE